MLRIEPRQSRLQRLLLFGAAVSSALVLALCRTEAGAQNAVLPSPMTMPTRSSEAQTPAPVATSPASETTHKGSNSEITTAATQGAGDRRQSRHGAVRQDEDEQIHTADRSERFRLMRDSEVYRHASRLGQPVAEVHRSKCIFVTGTSPHFARVKLVKEHGLIGYVPISAVDFNDNCERIEAGGSAWGKSHYSGGEERAQSGSGADEENSQCIRLCCSDQRDCNAHCLSNTASNAPPPLDIWGTVQQVLPLGAQHGGCQADCTNLADHCLVEHCGYPGNSRSACM